MTRVGLHVWSGENDLCRSGENDLCRGHTGQAGPIDRLVVLTGLSGPPVVVVVDADALVDVSIPLSAACRVPDPLRADPRPAGVVSRRPRRISVT